MPLSGTPISERLRSYLVNDNFPFSIIYAAKAGAIVVVAIAYQSRRPGYWKHRLPLRSVRSAREFRTDVGLVGFDNLSPFCNSDTQVKIQRRRIEGPPLMHSIVGLEKLSSERD